MTPKEIKEKLLEEYASFDKEIKLLDIIINSLLYHYNDNNGKENSLSYANCLLEYLEKLCLIRQEMYLNISYFLDNIHKRGTKEKLLKELEDALKKIRKDLSKEMEHYNNILYGQLDSALLNVLRNKL